MANAQKRKNVHFEIQALQGTGWTILGLEYDEKAALKKGGEVWDTGRYTAVKVIRERYHRESATFNSIELFYRGKKRKTSKIDEERNVSTCWKPGDFYSYEGRRTIEHLLEQSLDEWQITATELTHCPDYYYRLDDAGTVMQNVVQRAAVAQVGDTGQSVQERMKQLFVLIEQAVSRIRKDWEKDIIPSWKEGHFDTLIQKLSKSTDKGYLLTSAIVKDLAEYETLREKFTRVFSLVRTDHPGWVLKIIDIFTAELISKWGILSDLLGDTPNKGDQLISIARLSQGMLQEALAADTETECDDIKKLNTFLETPLLPYCRITLEQQLFNGLKSSQRLCDGPLSEEFAYISLVIRAMHKPDDSLIGGIPILEIAEERCARLLNSQTIGDYITAESSPVEEVTLLLDLENHILGTKNKRSLANYIMPIISSQGNEAFFSARDGKYLERMQAITHLQQRILISGFQDLYKRKLAEILDDFCLAILHRSELFERLDKSGNHVTDKSQSLLKLIKSGFFTEGEALKAAKNRVQEFINNPAFIKAVTAGAADGGEKSRTLMEFKEMLREAGMAEMV